jgi:uncharacterized membrane protein
MEERKPEKSAESWTSVLLPLGLILGLVLLLRFSRNSEGVGTLMGGSAEAWLKLLVGYVAAGAEIIAAFVVGTAAVQGFYSYTRALARRGGEASTATENIRLKLGRALALGLEFTIASDILRTAVAPTPGDIMNLAAIVLLRTLLNYFLEQEIRVGEGRHAEPA